MPEEVLDDGNGYSPAQELDGPGVAEDMGMVELAADAGLLAAQVEHTAKAHGGHLENLAFHVREMSPVGGDFAGDIQGHGKDADGPAPGSLLQGGEANFPLAEVDVLAVVEARVGFVFGAHDLAQAGAGETQDKICQPVAAAQAPLLFGGGGVVPFLEGIGQGIELGFAEVVDRSPAPGHGEIGRSGDEGFLHRAFSNF